MVRRSPAFFGVNFRLISLELVSGPWRYRRLQGLQHPRELRNPHKGGRVSLFLTSLLLVATVQALVFHPYPATMLWKMSRESGSLKRLL